MTEAPSTEQTDGPEETQEEKPSKWQQFSEGLGKISSLAAFLAVAIISVCLWGALGGSLAELLLLVAGLTLVASRVRLIAKRVPERVMEAEGPLIIAGCLWLAAVTLVVAGIVNGEQDVLSLWVVLVVGAMVLWKYEDTETAATGTALMAGAAIFIVVLAYIIRKMDLSFLSLGIDFGPILAIILLILLAIVARQIKGLIELWTKWSLGGRVLIVAAITTTVLYAAAGYASETVKEDREDPVVEQFEEDGNMGIETFQDDNGVKVVGNQLEVVGYPRLPQVPLLLFVLFLGGFALWRDNAEPETETDESGEEPDEPEDEPGPTDGTPEEIRTAFERLFERHVSEHRVIRKDGRGFLEPELRVITGETTLTTKELGDKFGEFIVFGRNKMINRLKKADEVGIDLFTKNGHFRVSGLRAINLENSLLTDFGVTPDQVRAER